jgi:hypothetical protein
MTTIESLRRLIDPAVARAAGAVRRMAITVSGAKAIWQLSGFRMPDGSTETRQAEVFAGIGFFARPAAGGKPEAIALMINDAKTPIVVAVRDEATRAQVAGELAADETMLFNSQAVVHAKANATVEIRTPTGTPEKMIKGETYRTNEDTMLTAISGCILALKAVLTALDTYANAIKGIADPTSGNPATTTLHTALVTVATPVLDATKTAIDTFQAAASTYLATVGKVE